ncbi:MAG: argininosuccinate lyase [Bacteroidetes bacterium]|nr:argininosuccinate lyase [Bacteroidota bacterium]
MAKLWDKGYAVHSLIEEFTVGNDWELDRNLVISDCVASAAHAEMLESIGILEVEEKESLFVGLADIISKANDGNFPVTRENEDCHTAIEHYLTENCGKAGKKIHTGRSRNDQIQTALRIWMRDFLFSCIESSVKLVDAAAEFAGTHAMIPMPGRTHMQIAMPSSIGLWAGAYAEELSDETAHLFSILELIDQCPLGSAASYGVPLPLNRELTADLLGFKKVQNNVLYANNSRGKFEAMVIDGLDYICLTLSKIAQDLILYSMPEFGYFSLPKELCTGSSIMPQKKNPDVFELIRSRSAQVSACSVQIKNIIRSLPSGYNRDFQDTKGAFLTAAYAAYNSIEIMRVCFEQLEVHPEKLRKAFTPEIFATDQAIDAVLSGKSFRDAYKSVGTDLGAVVAGNPDTIISTRTSTGTTGNLMLAKVLETNKIHALSVQEKRESVEAAVIKLMGERVAFFRPGTSART